MKTGLIVEGGANLASYLAGQRERNLRFAWRYTFLRSESPDSGKDTDKTRYFFQSPVIWVLEE